MVESNELSDEALGQLLLEYAKAIGVERQARLAMSVRADMFVKVAHFLSMEPSGQRAGSELLNLEPDGILIFRENRETLKILYADLNGDMLQQEIVQWNQAMSVRESLAAAVEYAGYGNLVQREYS